MYIEIERITNLFYIKVKKKYLIKIVIYTCYIICYG